MDVYATDYDPRNLFNLAGKRAFVTGASVGLGRRFAWTLAKAGAEVIVAARSTDKLMSLSEEIEKCGGSCVVETLDMRDRTAIRECVERTEIGGPINIVINNAGIAIVKSPDRYQDEDWDAVVEVNLTAQFLCSRAAARHMLAQEKGRIITIASIVGLRGNAYFPHLAYQATKGALVNMTRGLAVEWGGRGIRVNAIAPTFFKTNFGVQMRNDPDFVATIEARTPLGRFGEPEELAGGLQFLAGHASSMVTGHTLAIDGGWLAA